MYQLADSKHYVRLYYNFKCILFSLHVYSFQTIEVMVRIKFNYFITNQLLIKSDWCNLNNKSNTFFILYIL